MDVKKEVAFSLVRQYYDEPAARGGGRAVPLPRSGQGDPRGDRRRSTVPAELRGTPLPWPDLLAALEHEGKKLIASKSEFRRLMQQGGFYVEQEPVRETGALYEPKGSVLIRLGKRRFFRVRQ